MINLPLSKSVERKERINRIDMNLILLQKKSVNIKEFIDFWSKFYMDPNEKKYSENINKTKFDKHTLLSLFEWKNGSKLSKRKMKSFEIKILAKLKIINSLKASSDFRLNEFLAEFKDLSIIWKIFLLHIIRPNEYPVFDQHVYRAFYYIKHFPNIMELPNDNERKEKCYFKEYLPFLIRLKKGSQLKNAMRLYGLLANF